MKEDGYLGLVKSPTQSPVAERPSDMEEAEPKRTPTALKVDTVMAPATVALNAWSSYMVHQGMGGKGTPVFEEATTSEANWQGGQIVADPVIMTRAQLAKLIRERKLMVADRSDVTYDATPKKYERLGERVDERIISMSAQVVRALNACHPPVWFLEWLLYRWPDKGRYVPYRPSGWAEDPHRSWIVYEGGREKIAGHAQGYKVERGAIAVLRSIDASFMTDLRHICR